MIGKLKEQVVTKGKEINEFIDKHNIQIQKETMETIDEGKEEEPESAEKSSGVLVSGDSPQT